MFHEVPRCGPTHPIQTSGRFSIRMSAPQRLEPGQAASRSALSDSAATSAEAVLLEWTVHLLRPNPRRAFAVLATALAAGASGLLFFHSVLFGAVGAFLILASTAEFLFPIRYRLTTTRASCSFGLTRYEISWPEVRRLIATADGVKLSPLAIPSRLDAFRGVLLRFADDHSPGNRAGVMQIVEARAGQAHEERARTLSQAKDGV
jgi:hypothetical protein